MTGQRERVHMCVFIYGHLSKFTHHCGSLKKSFGVWQWRHVCVCASTRKFMSCQCACAGVCVCIFVWLQPSSSLTCAMKPRGLKGFCSLSANPNKTQAEPEWGMSARLVIDAKGQRRWVWAGGTVCLFSEFVRARHMDQLRVRFVYFPPLVCTSTFAFCSSVFSPCTRLKVPC